MAYGLNDVIQQRKLIQSGEGDEAFRRRANQHLDAMLGLCETVRCRRGRLLAYFGQDPDLTGCGNCDTCLAPPETWDGTVAAQKVLSTVVRLQRERGQKFGAVQIVDILLGRRTAKVIQFDHDQLSVFGIGEELTEAEWRGVVRQLLAQGLLAVEGEYGTLVLTEASGSVLRREREVPLRKEPKKPTAARGTSGRGERKAKAAAARAARGASARVRGAARLARRAGPRAGRPGVRHLPRRHPAGDRHGVAHVGGRARRDQRGGGEEAGDVRGGRGGRAGRVDGAGGRWCRCRCRCRVRVRVRVRGLRGLGRLAEEEPDWT
ncbi:hypothetical protein GCM10023238_21230 [Streptomyces heliomycini]